MAYKDSDYTAVIAIKGVGAAAAGPAMAGPLLSTRHTHKLEHACINRMSHVRSGNNNMGTFLQKGFSNWKDATECFRRRKLGAKKFSQ